jgi:dihydroneopterin aldolase
MATIHLHNVSLFAYHGIYEHEKAKGSMFEIDLDVVYDEKEKDFVSIKDTINYEILFAVVQQQMNIPTELLEKVCVNIIDAVKEKYSIAKQITITVYKLQAPIKDFKGKVGVTFSRKY